MMQNSPYLPIFELTRGSSIESVHYGAVAVVEASGRLAAWYGDPKVVTFLRSTAKPFQALPFIESGGASAFNLTQQEIAILCASHSGTDEHVAVVRTIQGKTGTSESELLCGAQPPSDEATLETMRVRQEQSTANRHNCSGKHTGMLAFVRLLQLSHKNVSDPLYIDPAHPIQQEILRTFADMCMLKAEQVSIGIDGCSAPNFAVPLQNAALAYARLSDPENGGVEPPERRKACHTITSSMTAHPTMVAGPGKFDTQLMALTRGRMVSKGGAEGYRGIGLLPGAITPASPAMGITVKIADGDSRKSVSAAVTLEVLRQLGALTPTELEHLSEFGPEFQIYNDRQIRVGRAYPSFSLNWAK